MESFDIWRVTAFSWALCSSSSWASSSSADSSLSLRRSSNSCFETSLKASKSSWLWLEQVSQLSVDSVSMNSSLEEAGFRLFVFQLVKFCASLDWSLAKIVDCVMAKIDDIFGLRNIVLVCWYSVLFKNYILIYIN